MKASGVGKNIREALSFRMKNGVTFIRFIDKAISHQVFQQCQKQTPTFSYLRWLKIARLRNNNISPS